MSNKKKIISGVCAIVGILSIIIAFVLSGNKTYKISFDTDGGSFVSVQEVKSGEKVVKPSNPTKDGYSFTRWEYQNKEYDFTKEVEEDFTLKAIWEKIEETKYNITITVNGKTQTVEASDFSQINLEELGIKEKDGYILKWYLDGKEYDIENALTNDISIEGKYEKTENFVVKFNSDGGSKINNQTVIKGEKVKEPTNPTKEAFVFNGWYLNNNKYDFDTAVTKNITLIAKWTEDPNVKRYEVVFDSDGGTTVAKQRVIENKVATQPSNPTKQGFTFDGWYLDNNKYNFSSKVSKNITLVAKWKEVIKYTIKFNSDGGSDVKSQTVAEGNKIIRPTNPTKKRYAFGYWVYDDKEYDFNKAVSKDMELKAIWKKQYIVKFETNGGSNVASQTIVEGNKVTKPSNPTKTNYDFVEWQLDGKTYDFSNSVNGDITLNATWIEKEDTSTYTIEVKRVDNYSSAITLKVLKDGKEISVNEIKYLDGTNLCYGSKMIADLNDIKDYQEYIVELQNGKEVKAKLK